MRLPSTVGRVLVLAELATTAVAADTPKPAPAAAKDTVVTGQHNGYTNDKLFLKTGDGKELKLLVEIEGDKDRKWHDQFPILSRIAVTYHTKSDGTLVATAIKLVSAK